ncbi:hypothetical protein GCM10010913_10230 [Paenibacillus aceti]|uniref:Uncharacterized protein n=1 Tax=Paenibacillus aceti TaxID=1820010 RepID=A0ABQ1VRT9_9BACL|nr:hypothetical protein GCM10010913_10230 [Paenibacillus aceti]
MCCAQTFSTSAEIFCYNEVNTYVRLSDMRFFLILKCGLKGIIGHQIDLDSSVAPIVNRGKLEVYGLNLAKKFA